MPTILRAADRTAAARVAFNFEDLGLEARQYLDNVRAEAAEIVAHAREEVEAVRAEARQAGLEDAEEIVARQIAPALPAVKSAAAEIQQARQACLVEWETRVVHLAATIAARVIRCELSRQPEIPLALVREALELAAGAPQIRVQLNPADHNMLGSQARLLLREIPGLGDAELLPDPAVTPGGCRVETSFGTIDQQIEAQLARIEEELTDV